METVDQAGANAVGYEPYCHLLENAVRTLKKLPPNQIIDVEINLPGESYLPPDYMPDQRAKIDLYRRLSRLATVAHLGELRAELIDRFGPPPETVERMLTITELKLLAPTWQVSAIHREEKYLAFDYQDARRIEHLARQHGGKKLRVVDAHLAYATLPRLDLKPDEMLAFVKSLLQPPTEIKGGRTH